MEITSRLRTFTELLLRASFWPTFDDEGRTRNARTFHGIAWWSLIIISSFLLLMVFLQAHTLHRRLNTIGMLTALFVALLWVNKRGHFRTASWLLVLGLTAVTELRAYTTGGMNAPTLSLFIYICMIAGTLLGVRAGALTGFLLASLGLWTALLQQAGHIPQPQVTFDPMTTWCFSCMGLCLSVLLHPQITRALSSSLNRAQAEVAARNVAEERLRIALDAGSIGVWEQDVRSRRIRADQRLFELYELTPSTDGTVSYESWLTRLHPGDRQAIEASFEALSSGKVAATQREFRLALPSGAQRHVFGAGNAVRNERGAVVRIVGVNRDITERTQAFEERARLVHDLGERVKELRLLHRAARLLQQSHRSDRELFQELAQILPDAWQFPESCRARITYLGEHATTPGFSDTIWRQSKAFTTSDGNGVIDIVYLDARPQSDEGPFLAEERALLDSLAEMLVSHLELRKHQQDLEQLVSTRTREMQQAKDEAERASRAKSTFLATMSHEIRTPLNAVLGYAQLLRRDAELGAPQRRQVDTILESGEHLLTLISDVLEMSKIEAGRAELVPEPVELTGLLDGIRHMFEALARAKTLSLAFELSSDLPKLVEADAGKLRQVVINLLSNAVKFTAHGGVTLQAAVAERSAERYLIQIVVADTGTGIAETDLPRIFQKFEQVGAGVQAGGTGLGLAIGRQLARLMGGDVTVSSRIDAGSSFVFTFEAVQASSEVQAKLARGRVVGLKPGQSRRKILVVDDVADNVDIAVTLFRAIGLEAQGAASGEAALELHGSWRPDLVLMDLRMPGIGGLEAIRRLHATGLGTVLVAFTASGFEELTQAARDAGASAVVFKPYRETQLLETIAELLGLALAYEADEESSAFSEAMVGASLAALLNSVPLPLRQRLRSAALQARAQRVQSIANEVDTFSPKAAREIRKLVHAYRYEELANALAGDPLMGEVS